MKTVLITGCSSGIGRITAELFAAQGWRVVATARNRDSLDGWQSDDKLALQLDVTDESSIAAAVASALARFGAIDVLVNNAGYGLFGPLEGAANGELEAQFQVNVFGAAAMIRHVLPGMRERRSGTIVNVSSIAGRTASPFASAYHASKYAIEGLSESLRFELSLHGVRVKLVEPALFKTGFIRRSLACTRHDAYNAAFDNYLKWVYLENEKAPAAHPVANAIYRAATDKSAKLRYPVNAKLIMALTALLPDVLWRSLLAEGMTRKPKRDPQAEANPRAD